MRTVEVLYKPSQFVVTGYLCALFFLHFLLVLGCSESDDRTEDGRVMVEYWEHWTDFEGEAMQAVVDDFNASQDRIFVKVLTISEIEQKILLATAGGNPPDVVGLWSRNVAPYAEKCALTPLNKYLDEAGITKDDYLPAMWDLCDYRGYVWALPSTPGTIGLHWNKRLFREAGLDPDKPPASIRELDEMAERLTIVDIERDGKTQRVRYTELTNAEREAKQFDIRQLGFSPAEPGWWKDSMAFWFGAELYDGDRKLLADTPEVLATLQWYGGYPEKYGVDNMKKFGASFGNSFASPQNPFLDERIAMVLQGVWMYNFIDKFSPQLEWSAAPFPSHDPVNLPSVTISDCDILAIPAGAKHPDEAFEFIRYVNSRGPMEKLCLGQRKFSPLATYSQDFVANHPNPQIQVFIDMAASPNSRIAPELPVWQEYREELQVAFDRVFGGRAEPGEAAAYAQERAQWKFDRALKRWDMTGEKRLEQWAQQ